MTITESLVVTAGVITFATMGGVYFTFSTFVMRALNELPAGQASAAMNAINRVILTSWFMPLFFGSSLLALAGIGYGVVKFTAPLSQLLAVSAGTIYLLGMLGVTILFNVPLNNQLAESSASAANDHYERELWRNYYRRWSLFNHIRTMSCILSATLLLIIGLN